MPLFTFHLPHCRQAGHSRIQAPSSFVLLASDAVALPPVSPLPSCSWWYMTNNMSSTMKVRVKTPLTPLIHTTPAALTPPAVPRLCPPPSRSSSAA